MVLTLTVPALEDNPLIVAETRPQQITQFISKLPFGKPFEAAVLMREEMEILNRQKIAAEIRFKALEVYHRALFNLKETLAIQFCNEPSPLNKHAKDFAAVAESLLLELSYGYKLALIDHQNKLISLSGSKSKAAIILRAIETLGQLAMVYYQTYFSVPPASGVTCTSFITMRRKIRCRILMSFWIMPNRQVQSAKRINKYY